MGLNHLLDSFDLFFKCRNARQRWPRFFAFSLVIGERSKSFFRSFLSVFGFILFQIERFLPDSVSEGHLWELDLALLAYAAFKHGYVPLKITAWTSQALPLVGFALDPEAELDVW